MSDISNLSDAAQARVERAIDEKIDVFIEQRLSKVKLAAPISATAKIKLRGILKKYSKESHPFRACVRDNAKKFGPGRTEAICATLKDTIRGNKSWRNGSGKVSAADISIDGEVLLALDAISEIDLQAIFLEARAMDEYGTSESVALLDVGGTEELQRWGDDGEVGLAIIANRSSSGEEES